MKISAVITKKPRIKMRELKLNFSDRTLLLIFSVMLFSIIGGAVSYRIKSALFKTAIFDSFVAFSTDLSGKSFFEAFSGFFAVDLSALIVFSILGTSVFGELPILIATVFRTIGIGALGAYLFDSFALEGFKYFLIIILPGKILMFFALLLTVQNCFQMSRKIRINSTGKSNEFPDLKIYLIRNSVAMVIFALSAVTDTFLLRFLSQYFIPNF